MYITMYGLDKFYNRNLIFFFKKDVQNNSFQLQTFEYL